GGWSTQDPSCQVEQFCSEYNEWRGAARMPTRRGGVAVGTLGGHIYTVGGEDHARRYSNVEVCLVEMDGYLYAIGGHDGITAINTVEYDPKMNSWSKQIAMSTRRSRAVAAVLNGKLYVMGGNDGDMALNSVSLVVFNGALLAVGGSDGLTDLKTMEIYCHESNHYGSMKRKHPGGRV
uniref:Uncharacterized protein n=1 Tax=Periophthalmus magnuspinnatus TaxID=409849 RepID=A0A3B4B7L3_9GOBI